MIDWRKKYEYEIDGIIVTDNKIYKRQNKNPEHAFAFKMIISDQVAEAKVVDVIWTPSKNGYLKPRVRIEPVNIGGVNIEYATGFNAKFIESNKIGVGAVIEIIRSGDVIPYIKSITMPADEPKMPNKSYHWTETRIDIILDNMEEDDTVQQKNITDFFTTIKVEGLSSGNVKRLMNAGFDTIPKIIYMTKEDYETVDGFGKKMIDKIYDGIQNRLNQSSLIDIMVASNIFGRGIGDKKIRLIMNKYPEILNLTNTVLDRKSLLLEIDGIGEENANGFIRNIERFLVFLDEIKLTYKLSEKPMIVIPKKNETHILNGKNVVMTKVRDANILAAL